MNNVFYFEIQSDNPEKSMQFYGTVFGWKFVKQEGTPIDYWQIQSDGIPGGLLGRPALAPAMGTGTNAFTCSMEVEDFDATATVILENGGTVAMEKFAVPGKCWQGYFLDTDHNVFGLFQPDEQAA